jgi:hypothetical protein
MGLMYGRRRPGMCCECGKPECPIGPFTRRCGSGPSSSSPYSPYFERPIYRDLDSDEWVLIGDEYDSYALVRVRRWRNRRTGETRQQAIRESTFEEYKRYQLQDFTERPKDSPGLYKMPYLLPAYGDQSVEDTTAPVKAEETESLEAALAEWEKSYTKQEV